MSISDSHTIAAAHKQDGPHQKSSNVVALIREVGIERQG